MVGHQRQVGQENQACWDRMFEGQVPWPLGMEELHALRSCIEPPVEDPKPTPCPSCHPWRMDVWGKNKVSELLFKTLGPGLFSWHTRKSSPRGSYMKRDSKPWLWYL